MADKLSDARRSLEKAKESAQRRLTDIETERREIKASLKSLDAAIRALNGRKQASEKHTPDEETQRSDARENHVSE